MNENGQCTSDTEQIAVAKCPNCGYVYGDDLDYRFPNASECLKCGAETENTTVADPVTVRSLSDDGLRPDGGTDREPEIYDAVEAPRGYDCQQWHARGARDQPVECQNDADVLFVHEASLDPDDDQRRNCLGCEDCAPVLTEDVREVNPDA